jgi:hypothetical protein
MWITLFQAFSCFGNVTNIIIHHYSNIASLHKVFNPVTSEPFMRKTCCKKAILVHRMPFHNQF